MLPCIAFAALSLQSHVGLLDEEKFQVYSGFVIDHRVYMMCKDSNIILLTVYVNPVYRKLLLIARARILFVDFILLILDNGIISIAGIYNNLKAKK